MSPRAVYTRLLFPLLRRPFVYRPFLVFLVQRSFSFLLLPRKFMKKLFLLLFKVLLPRWSACFLLIGIRHGYPCLVCSLN